MTTTTPVDVVSPAVAPPAVAPEVVPPAVAPPAVAPEVVPPAVAPDVASPAVAPDVAFPAVAPVAVPLDAANPLDETDEPALPDVAGGGTDVGGAVETIGGVMAPVTASGLGSTRAPHETLTRPQKRQVEKYVPDRRPRTPIPGLSTT
jgi:hypothetical protein